LQAKRRDQAGLCENPEGESLLLADFSLAAAAEQGSDHTIRASDTVHFAPIAIDQHVSSSTWLRAR
jgi:hypothetical protein